MKSVFLLYDAPWKLQEDRSPIKGRKHEFHSSTEVSCSKPPLHEDGRVHKQKFEGTVDDAKEDSKEQLQPFASHVYNIRRQYAGFRKMPQRQFAVECSNHK